MANRPVWTLVGTAAASLLVAVVVAFLAFVFVGQRMARSGGAQALDPRVTRDGSA